MAYGYTLAGKASSADANFIPSLIGVKADQRVPGATDVYFEQQELRLYHPGCILSVERTNMVSYDSLPSNERDPILACRAAGFAFYITASEAFDMAHEESDDGLLALLKALLPSRPPVAV